MTPRQAMTNTAAVLLVIGIAWLLIQIREILIILILAITFAAAITPIVAWLRTRRFSWTQAIMAIYVGVLLIVGIGGYLVVPPLIAQGATFLDDIPAILQNLEEQARQSNSTFLRTSGARAIGQVSRRYAELSADPSPVGETAIKYVDTVARMVFGVFTVFVVTYYWMTQRALVKRLSLGLIPLARRERAYRIWDEIEERLGGWARGQLVLSGVIGGVSTAGYWLLGLDFWLTLGIIAGITEVIPFVGPIIGGGLAVMVALTDSPEKALLTLGFVIALQQLEGAVLVPRVMRNAVGLNPLSVILAVLVGGTVLGPLGAVIAIPLAAALQVLVANLWEERDDQPDFEVPGSATDIDDTTAPRPLDESGVDAAEGQEEHAAHIRTL
ncbi:N/A [soil metagenome]